MDEIDEAIAYVNQIEAEREAKKNRKKRSREESLKSSIDDAVNGQSKSDVEVSAPPKKKTKPNKKAQQKVYNAIFGKDACPIFKLTLNNLKTNDCIGMKDIRNLITSIAGNGVTVTWANISASSMIKHVLLIVLDSLSYELYQEASEKNLMPYLTSNFQSTPSKAPGNTNRVCDGVSVLLRHPMSKSRIKQQKKSSQAELMSFSGTFNIINNQKMELSETSSKNEQNDQNTNQNQEEDIHHIDDQKEEKDNSMKVDHGLNDEDQKKRNEIDSINGPSITIEDLKKRFEYSLAKANESFLRDAVILSPGQCVLTPNELLVNLYPLPHNTVDPQFVEIPKHRIPKNERLNTNQTQHGQSKANKLHKNEQQNETEQFENQQQNNQITNNEDDNLENDTEKPKNNDTEALTNNDDKHTTVDGDLHHVHDNQQSESPQRFPAYQLLAIDCEMCRTTWGIELTRVVIVNINLDVVYDSYVKPHHEVLDYLTRYSGIEAHHLSNVTVRLEDVQNDLLKIISPQTILVGHSLENDLKALKIFHHRVVDTALLYPHSRGDTWKNSLKFLAENWLKEEIQVDNHNPIQDAITAMKLALLKFRMGSNFGNMANADGEENLMEYFSRLGKRTVIIDNAHHCKLYAGSHTDCHGEEGDAFVAERARKAFGSCRYEFSFARLRELEKYYQDIELAISHHQKSGETDSVPAIAYDRNKELEICKQLDTNLKTILSDAPKRSLVIVTGGHGNLAKVRAVSSKRRKSEQGTWTEADDENFKQVFEAGRATVTFFGITPAGGA